MKNEGERERRKKKIERENERYGEGERKGMTHLRIVLTVSIATKICSVCPKSLSDGDKEHSRKKRRKKRLKKGKIQE